jgi:hypothetical protein
MTARFVDLHWLAQGHPFKNLLFRGSDGMCALVIEDISIPLRGLTLPAFTHFSPEKTIFHRQNDGSQSKT